MPFAFPRLAPLRAASAALAVALLVAALAPAVAGPRAATMGAVFELIGAEYAEPHARAGIAIRLEPGWKTYWRYPGDSGIAPMLDWTGSTNVAGVALAFPAPRRFPDPMGTAIGYKAPVVLPLAITPVDPARAIDLRLKVDLGLCRDICVPAHADLAARVEPGRPALAGEAAELAAFAARVPRPVALADPAAPLRLVTLAPVGGRPPEFVATVAAPDHPAGAPVDVLAEGPEGWALPLPEQLDAGAGAGVTRWRLVLDGVPRAATISGSRLRLTLIQGDTAVETEVTLP